MTCCCPHSRSASRLFSLLARHYRRRFARDDFEPSQRQLLAGITAAGFTGATILEVGAGVGHLHQALLERGAASAVGIDLAPAMLEQARQRAAEHGLASRTDYRDGDFLQLTGDITPAELTILDKVVCCYPDAPGLIGASLDKTQRVLALTYPRQRWTVRLGVDTLALLLRLLRSEFRPYLHDPAAIERQITARGFAKRFEATTPVWLTQVYVRD